MQSQSQHSQYEKCLSIDMRCFDNSKPDMGVEAFLERLGFVPTKLFNHETYMDQIHLNNGIIDDQRLKPQWTSQRAMPGVQVWTKRQFRRLIDVLHQHGIEFYQGCEAAWSCWPEYGKINRCEYLYEHLPEIFIVDRNGDTTAEKAMGAINPLCRLKDGSYYEDLLIQDVLRFLEDYDCDGFFAADGFAGLAIPLRNGCYSDDMIGQFTERTGIEVPEGDTPDRARFIWDRYRYEWTEFYADRWADFHAKLSSAMRKAGKGLVIFTPWQLGPADALAEYGFDYGKSRRAGITCMALEIMEEITSRRFVNPYGWEAVGISNAATAKAAADGLKLLWTTSTCNCPEHWHTLRDQPNIIERECLALGCGRTIAANGERVPITDGVLTIFGIDLECDEWRWLKRRWDEGYSYAVKKPLGPAIVWSDDILYSHLRLGERWPISPVVSKLRYAGLPVSQAVDLRNVRQAPDTDLLLIDPIGLRSEDAKLLAEAVQEGRTLICVGRVDNEELLRLLGLTRTQDTSDSRTWTLTQEELADYKEMMCGADRGLCGYAAEQADSLVRVEGGDTALCVRKVGKGQTIYIRRLTERMPAVDLPKTAVELAAYPCTIEEQGNSGFHTIREQLNSIASLHPDALDLLAVRAIQHCIPELPVPDLGQMVGFEDEDGSQVLILENSANLMYLSAHVRLPAVKKSLSEYPEIKHVGPVDYVFYSCSQKDSFDVCIPPDAGIPVKIRY